MCFVNYKIGHRRTVRFIRGGNKCGYWFRTDSNHHLRTKSLSTFRLKTKLTQTKAIDLTTI